MKKKYRIKQAKEFEEIIKNGNCIKNKFYVIHFQKSKFDYDRYGISVSKKVGNSVVRHRVKRVIREVIRLNNDCIIQGYDIVIVGRSDSASGDYQKIESAILHLLNLHHLMSDNNRI